MWFPHTEEIPPVSLAAVSQEAAASCHQASLVPSLCRCSGVFPAGPGQNPLAQHRGGQPGLAWPGSGLPQPLGGFYSPP